MQANVNKDVIKLVQTSLNRHYSASLKVDGVAGKATAAELLKITAIPSHWGMERQLVGYIQHICNFEDIDAGPVDGFWGPQTEYGYEVLRDKLKGTITPPWRDDEGLGGKPEATDKWPLQVQSELVAFYGEVGTGQVKIRSPYPLKIAWSPEKTVNNITCHGKVHESVLRVLTNVRNHYGLERIRTLGLDMWGGCLNVRKMRGGTKWSTHSWGIAMDWDPARNRLRWNKHKAHLAQPEYGMWWKYWEDEGWVSLGRERDYDWMHVQAAKIKK